MKGIEVKTFQFLGGDCIQWTLFVSRIVTITISINVTHIQVCFHLLCCILSF